MQQYPNHVLIVEDEEEVARITGSILEKIGFSPLDVGSVEELRATIKDGNFDLKTAIIDMTLPDGDGLEAAEIIRSRYPDTPILFISGYTEASWREAFDKFPASGFIQKPYRQSELAEKLRTLLK